MANASLTVPPFSRNDISIIAHHFEISFDYYLSQDSPFYLDYLRALRTLVGLGFTASLADKNLFYLYQRYLADFIELKSGDFRQCPSVKIYVAEALAEMVSIAATSFKALEHPSYYENFLEVLHQTMAEIPKLSIENNEAWRIFDCLSVN